jgi:hypothetical protein
MTRQFLCLINALHATSFFNTGVQRLVRIVLEALWTKFVGPVLLWPLLCHRGGMPLWAAGRQRSNPSVSTTAAKAAVDGPAGIQRSASTSTLLPSGQALNALEHAEVIRWKPRLNITSSSRPS